MPEILTPESPGYDQVRRPVNPAFQDVRPRLVVRCESVADVVGALAHATATGLRLVPRGGGHCFAGRSSTDGILLDLSRLDGITVDGGIATIGAGARLAQVYAALHGHGVTLPAGCGPTVGIAGLTLGGGIGLLGRRYGLTCDRLIGAQVVLADGSVVECDQDRHPDLFWALRGAGGGQFGVVTELRFATVPEPLTTRISACWPDADVAELVSAWQAWAPDAPGDLTVNLTLVAEPGAPVVATLFGAATLAEDVTRQLLRDFTDRQADLRGGLPFHRLKQTFLDPEPAPAHRIRSEFFARALSDDTLAALLDEVGSAPTRRQLTFTAMGGAYNHVPEDATAFAHRGERFLLEHLGAPADRWIDRSWAITHPDGSGRVYPNFPDPALDDWPAAYHAGNYQRLTAVKQTYDPHRFFDFPQAV
ncbi:FAD/FMN-containing dehydrogenase [Actinoplanes octamycinicus]|uniref:FAD/FMN-containing dehydrogenase n=1 Tax=Actinoplanes octamycinicus TaxID=135948 RepID=A0A7W7H4E8_9ACTN|nr:FAD-binding oxidoreductase [Actinoplanes octamycinicus]MBB4743815.1 FAD/FMN-containing dehydrogenase [Actinoplanes octamycinicus]GIE58443.1 FAD-binding dehydrogenase [Actinoplanes octamycinicus]